MVLAYIVIWVVLLAYIIWLARSVVNLKADIAYLKKELERLLKQ